MERLFTDAYGREFVMVVRKGKKRWYPVPKDWEKSPLAPLIRRLKN